MFSCSYNLFELPAQCYNYHTATGINGCGSVTLHPATDYYQFYRMQLLPSPYLSGIVKHFLVLETDVKEISCHRFFPDGHSGIVFHYGTPFLSHPGSYLYGQASGFQQMTAGGVIRMLIVVFQPYGAHALLKTPAFEFTDKIIPLRDLWGNVATRAEEQICTATDTLARIQVAEQLLLLKMKDQTTDLLVRQAVQQITRQHGLTSIQSLTDTLRTNERQLERKFRETIGLSPKQFSGIAKLQTALKALQARTAGQSLTDITYNCGYYDQAHFIRDIKKATGLTPRQYLLHTHALALNLVQLQPV